MNAKTPMKASGVTAVLPGYTVPPMIRDPIKDSCFTRPARDQCLMSVSEWLISRAPSRNRCRGAPTKLGRTHHQRAPLFDISLRRGRPLSAGRGVVPALQRAAHQSPVSPVNPSRDVTPPPATPACLNGDLFSDVGPWFAASADDTLSLLLRFSKCLHY